MNGTELTSELDWRKQVPSVGEVTRLIRGYLEGGFSDLWIRGEVSGLKKPVSGHLYFTLKDNESQIKVVVFKPVAMKFKFHLKDGMELIVHGRITLYEARGEYQIVADAVEPVGMGALQLAFEQLKEKLSKEGLFDAQHKKKIPFLPKKIAVITSVTGAAVRDILKVIQSRFPNHDVLVIGTNVQGDKAPPEIVKALALAEQWNQQFHKNPIEVIILGRGGGSIEDLWAFNEERVARAIFHCSIPIISAVGHEIDFTISDFVADVRAPTPSAAAEMVFPRYADLKYQVDSLKKRLWLGMRRALEQSRIHLGHLVHRLVDPKEKILQLKQKVMMLQERMILLMKHQVTNRRSLLEKRTAQLDAISPLKVLGRGFGLTYFEGKILKSVRDVSVGATLVTQLSDGKLNSKVV